MDFESPLWQTLYDAYERVTDRTVINRYSNDSYMGKRESAHMSPVEVAKGGALRGNPVYDNILRCTNYTFTSRPIHSR